MPTTPSTQLFPAVVDASTLGQKLSSSIFLPISIEGKADAAGDAAVGVLYAISRTDQAVQKFGPAARITALINAILARGAGPVIAVASLKGAGTPALADRQAAWALIESDEGSRIRLTDSVTQADLAALAVSCANANQIDNKQISVMGLASATSKAALIAGAAAIAAGGKEAATRSVLTGPAIFDDVGALQDGGFAAAVVAAEVAKNGDPSNDLDLLTLPLITGVERDVSGLPMFRRKVVAGVAVNDLEDLLQGGVSPLTISQEAPGGVAITHLRTVYITDSTHDSLMTRIIEDQVFLDVKAYLRQFLNQGNTEAVRKRIQSGVAALLHERISWISPIAQSDGTQGYAVEVSSSPDQRQVTVSYQGQIIRGIQTIQVSANLTITV